VATKVAAVFFTKGGIKMGIKLPNGFEIYVNFFGMICLAVVVTGVRKAIEAYADAGRVEDV
jgi:hypothetical protein